MGAAAVVAAPVIKAVAVGAIGAMVSKKMGKAPNLTAEGGATRNQLFDSSKILQNAGQQQLATGSALTSAGMRSFNAGDTDLNAASGYLRTLVGGSRGAMTAALGPEIGAITSAYRGAQSGLDRGGATGAVREMATADLAREKAGRISGLAMAVRPQAVGQLSQIGQARQSAGAGIVGMGQGATGTGISALSGANSPLSTIYQGELWRMGIQAQNQAAIGQFFANLMYEALKNRGGSSGGK
jgi:hypothetical protein